MPVAVTKFVSRLNLAGVRVDREKGIIKGVSIVALGEARGHDQMVDKTTLEQVRDCAKTYEGGLKVKFNPDSFAHGQASLAGRIPSESITIKGGRTVGDLHVYKHFADRDYLFEIAEEAPDHFGLSIDFSGVPEMKDGIALARCNEIYAATVVDLPAANPTGLFSASDESDKEKVMDEKTIKSLGTTIAAAVLVGLKPVLTQFRAQPVVDVAEVSDEERQAAGVEDDDTDEEIKRKVSEWRAKDGKDPVTKRDLMQFFSRTGGKPARVSAADDEDKDKKKSGTVTAFVSRINDLKDGGLPKGQAIAFARKDDPKGFAAWSRAGRPNEVDKDKKDKDKE